MRNYSIVAEVWKAVNKQDLQALEEFLTDSADSVIILSGKIGPRGELSNLISFLHEACRNEAIHFAERLLSLGSNINAKDDFGMTPLAYAIHHGKRESAVMMLQHGAEVEVPDKSGRTLSSWAMRNEHIDLAELLFSYGAQINLEDRVDGLTPFIWAIQKGNATWLARCCNMEHKPMFPISMDGLR